MKNIRNFNKNLNSSYDNNFKYKLWESYRLDVTDYILSCDLEDKSVLIVGAGNLNDIDIGKIIAETKKVMLLDIDSNSIIEGLERQNIDDEVVDIIEYDLTDLDLDEFIDEFKDSVLNSDTENFFVKYSNHDFNYELNSYDRIIILPIYTQILFHQMVSIVESLSVKNSREIVNEILSFVGALLAKINSQLVSLLNDEGKVIVLSDVLEYQADADEIQYLKSNISNKNAIDSFYENYLNNYGYSLGSYGLHDIEVKLNYIDDSYFLWNFDEKRSLLVRSVILK